MDIYIVIVLIIICQSIPLIIGQAVTSCADSPCKNDAICDERETGYQCFCVDGFAGDNCEINFDDCGSGPCKNNATCVDGVAGYTCSCLPGFIGQDCQINIDECQSSPCLMNATCIDLINGFACECEPPFRGDNCSLLPCDTVPCENEALCENDLTFNKSLTGYVCDCILGFSGVRCEINLEDCDLENGTSCTYNGLCVDGINDYSCLCEPGWIGQFCQLPVDDCIGNDCRHNSACFDQHLGYTCDCDAGYEGDLCERERDECTTWYPCKNEAICVDLFNAYRCECTSGWVGTNCTDEVDECLTNLCENGAQCLDIVDGFICRCAPFYTGELCQTPYNPCSLEYNPCQNGANCIAPPDGKYVCFCTKGFTGANCEVNINECLLFPCDNNATCEDITAGYVCHCRLGWTGTHCSKNIDDCASQPCYNGATCFDVLNGFHCNCTQEYTGRLCEEPVDFCLQTTCYNDGTCLRLIGDYQCQCLPPYTGRNCLDLMNECESFPCSNNATCTNTDSGYICACDAPFTGRTCDVIIDYCSSQPCLNGGSCRQLKEGWICICPIYLTGRQCTDLVDYCRDNPCLNDGVCINNEFGFRCLCLFGYTGEQCEGQEDFCANDPCLNSGSCSNIRGGFICNCASNFDGVLCEFSVTFTPTSSSSATTMSFIHSASLSSPFYMTETYIISTLSTLSFRSDLSITTIQMSDITSSERKPSSVLTRSLHTNMSDSSADTTVLAPSTSIYAFITSESTLNLITESHSTLASIEQYLSKTNILSVNSASLNSLESEFPTVQQTSTIVYTPSQSVFSSIIGTQYTSRMYSSTFFYSTSLIRLSTDTPSHDVSSPSTKPFFSTLSDMSGTNFFSVTTNTPIPVSSISPVLTPITTLVSVYSTDTFGSSIISTNHPLESSFTTPDLTHSHSTKTVTSRIHSSGSIKYIISSTNSNLSSQPTSGLTMSSKSSDSKMIKSSVKLMSSISLSPRYDASSLNLFSSSFKESPYLSIANSNLELSLTSEIVSQTLMFTDSQLLTLFVSSTLIMSFHSAFSASVSSINKMKNSANPTTQSFPESSSISINMSTSVQNSVNTAYNSASNIISDLSQLSDEVKSTDNQIMLTTESVSSSTFHLSTELSGPISKTSHTVPISSSHTILPTPDPLSTSYVSSTPSTLLTEIKSTSSSIKSLSDTTMPLYSTVSYQSLSGTSHMRLLSSLSVSYFTTDSSSIPSIHETSSISVSPYSSKLENASHKRSSYISLYSSSMMETSQYLQTISDFTTTVRTGESSIILPSLMHTQLSKSHIKPSFSFLSQTPLSYSFRSTISTTLIQTVSSISHIEPFSSSVIESALPDKQTSRSLQLLDSSTFQTTTISLPTGISDTIRSSWLNTLSFIADTINPTYSEYTTLHKTEFKTLKTESGIHTDQTVLTPITLSKYVSVSTVNVPSGSSVQSYITPTKSVVTDETNHFFTSSMPLQSMSQFISLKSSYASILDPSPSTVGINPSYSVISVQSVSSFSSTISPNASTMDFSSTTNISSSSVMQTYIPFTTTTTPTFSVISTSNLTAVMDTTSFSMMSTFSPTTITKALTSSSVMSTSVLTITTKTLTSSNVMLTSVPTTTSKTLTSSNVMSTSVPTTTTKTLTSSNVMSTSVPTTTTKTFTSSNVMSTSVPTITTKPLTSSNVMSTSVPTTTTKTLTSSNVMSTSVPTTTTKTFTSSNVMSTSVPTTTTKTFTSSNVMSTSVPTTTTKTFTSSSVMSTSVPTTSPVLPKTCDVFSCRNNGVCRHDVLGFYCDCAKGFVGLFCETETSVCDGIQCENEGECSVVTTTYNQQVPACSCPVPYSGTFCDEELLIYYPSFYGRSYLLFNSTEFSSTKTNEIFLSIKTTQLNGTILFSSGKHSTESTARTDLSYIQLYLEGGMIQYMFTCDGVLLGHIRTDQAVNTGDIYDIVLRQMWPSTAGDWCSASISVNTRTFVGTPLLAVKTTQELGDLVIGGILRHNYEQNAVISTDVINGYIGCVRSFQINGVEIDLIVDTKGGINVENCNVPVCQHNPCTNGATCHSSADDWYCECTTGYGGNLCEIKLCGSNPCLHGGSCIVLEIEKDTLCICPYGRGGTLCEQELKPKVPHFSGTVYGLASYMVYSDIHYITDNFQMEFNLLFEESSIDSSLILYMGNVGHEEGRADFFAVGLLQGYLLFRFNLGSGLGDVYSQNALDLSLPYHHIKLGRSGRTGWLQVDGQANVTGQSSGLLTALNVRSDLYVGGVDLAVLPSQAKFEDGLNGCIYNLKIKTVYSNFTEPGSPPGHVEHGRNVRECLAMSCDPNPCANGAECVDLGASIFCNCSDEWKGIFCRNKITICDVNHTCSLGSTCLPTPSGEYMCLCQLGKRGVNCNEDAELSDALFIGEESYMSFQPVYIKKSIDIHLEIRPSTASGLLFYTAFRLHSNAGDFLSVTLSDWIVELRYTLGSSLNVVRSGNKLENKPDAWSNIHVGRNSTHGFIIVDGQLTVVITTGSMLYLDTTSDFYLGGLPALTDASPLAFKDEPVAFEGCVRMFVVNAMEYELTPQGALSGRNIVDCDGTSCGYSTCKNGGECQVAGEGGGFNCTCTEGFHGDTCSLPEECLAHQCDHGNCVVNSPYRCDCHLGWTGDYCDLETSIGTDAAFRITSYLLQASNNDIDDLNITLITLSFRTTSLHGLLFWNGQTYTDDEDYLGVGVFEGRVKLVWNLGWYSRTESITSLRHNDGQWHFLKIKRQGKEMTLTVDDLSYESRVSGDFYQLDTGYRYYLGGFKDAAVKQNTLDNFKEPFVGCIRDFAVNGVVMQFDDAIEGLNVERCP